MSYASFVYLDDKNNPKLFDLIENTDKYHWDPLQVGE